MKKTITIILFIVSVGIAQNEQRSIELPDFVITGRQSIDVQTAMKKKPELISTLSEDFLTPQYSPEELGLLLSSRPKPIKPDITAENIFSGRLYLGAGIHTLPIGEFSLTQSIHNYLITANIWGSNTTEYISNAGFNTSGLSLNNNLFIDTDSGFLPGSNIRLNGSYSRNSYKFYGSLNPTFERKTNYAEANLSLSNYYSRWINFGFNLGAHYLDFKENSLSEKLISASGLFTIKLGNLSIGFNGTYSAQLLNNNQSAINSYNFYSTESFIKLVPTKTFQFKFGINYSALKNSSFFTPFGLMQLALDKNLTFQFEYRPHAEFFAINDFLNRNIFMTNRLIDNLFSEIKSDLKASFKYEYENYFSTSIWGRYSKTENYLYYEDITQNGFFDVLTSPDVQSVSLGMDLLYNTYIYGFFIGEARFLNTIDATEKIIPYTSKYSISLIYGYEFSFGLGFKLKYQALLDTYTNLTNTNKIDSYHNLSVGLSYKIFEALSLTADFQNILNRSNFVLNQYQDKPFDVILGIEYRW